MGKKGEVPGSLLLTLRLQSGTNIRIKSTNGSTTRFETFIEKIMWEECITLITHKRQGTTLGPTI